MPVHAAPPPPKLVTVERAHYAHGTFVRWDSFLCSPTGCRLVVRTAPSAVKAPIAINSRARGTSKTTFSNALQQGRTTGVGGGSVDQTDNGGLAGHGGTTGFVTAGG